MSLDYCDQPYLDQNHLVRYATSAQPLNCDRLWGVNRAMNQVARELDSWMSLRFLDSTPSDGERSIADAPRGALSFLRRMVFGVTPPESREPEFRGFPEGPRAMTPLEAFHLAYRECEIRRIIAATDGANPSQTVQRQGDERNASVPAAGPTGTSLDCSPARMEAARSQNLRTVAEQRRAPAPLASQSRTLRATLLIDAFSLYLLPVLFALLGALVALNRDLRRLSDQWRLSVTERPRGNTSLVLGAAFGAIVSLLAEVLRGVGTTTGATGTSATGVALGLWPLAFLAGYSVSHVFRMLDSAVDRVFGAPAR